MSVLLVAAQHCALNLDSICSYRIIMMDKDQPTSTQPVQGALLTLDKNEARIDLSVISSKDKFSQDQVDCLIILNSVIYKEMLRFFVGSSKHVILCDGGANQFYKSDFRDTANLKAIVGDMDSIRQEVKEYYSKRVEIKDLSSDQDTNDLEKSINYALSLHGKKIVCLGALGGRFDQQMCNINVLQKYSEHFKDTSFIAVGQSSLIYVVKPNVSTTIKVNNFYNKKQVGLICFSKAKVQTKGLRWNLGKEYGLEYLEWGVLVSSSNEIVDNEVSIRTSHSLLFTIEFPFMRN